MKRTTGDFLGNCVVFRYPDRILTAAHLVRDVPATQLGVVLPLRSTEPFEVTAVAAHPAADVAALTVAGISEDDITWPHYAMIDDRVWGVDFMAFGHPIDYGETGPSPTARLFRGHVQRFFQHTSFMGYRYVAAELSTGAPLGLSGGPVFNSQHKGRLYGIVAENIRVTTEKETVLQVKDGDKSHSEALERVINYGVAVWLPAIADWLDSQIPPVSDEELNRRAINQGKINAAKQQAQ